MAGLYFAFSAFIMTAFGRIEPAQGMAAMNAINVEIVRSAFMPVFPGTTLTSALLTVIGVQRWREPGAMAMLARGEIYVVGMFIVTVAFNVPLNDALAEQAISGSDAAPIWASYLRDWTFWNHVRTVSSTAAFMLYIAALLAR